MKKQLILGMLGVMLCSSLASLAQANWNNDNYPDWRRHEILEHRRHELEEIRAREWREQQHRAWEQHERWEHRRGLF